MRIRMDSTEPGANTSSSMKIRLLREVSWITFLCLQLASRNVQAICNDGEEIDPQAPDCFDDCQGRRFFLDRDGICKMCVQCEPGFQHDKYCGDGVNGDAICVPCPEDHFSFNLYDCVACRVCENTLITQECTPSTDRQCGECLPGYYRDPQNPDLCNQKCEWLSNPHAIPSCRPWVANQKSTTLSVDMSQMSSFPMATDQGSGHMSWTLIIIILLIFVLIAGSIVPVYFYCKYYRRDSPRPKDMETGTDHSQEHHEPADIGMDSVEQHCNSNGSRLNGAVTSGARVVPQSRTDVASESVIDFQISACHVQCESNVSIHNEEEKSEELMLMGIDSEGGQASGLREGDDEEDGSDRPDKTLTLHSNGPPKGIHVEGTVTGQVTEEHKPRALYSEEAGRSKEMARADEVDGGNGGSDEHQRLLPVVALGSTKGAEIKQNDVSNVEHMPPSGLASEVAKGEDEARADEGDDCREERNKHPKANVGVKDQSGGAEGLDDEEWRGSAEEERTQPIKGRKEKEASKTKPLQSSGKCGKKKKKKNKPLITLKFFGKVNTLVVGDQIHNHNYSTVREGEDYEEEEEGEEHSDQER